MDNHPNIKRGTRTNCSELTIALNNPKREIQRKITDCKSPPYQKAFPFSVSAGIDKGLAASFKDRMMAEKTVQKSIAGKIATGTDLNEDDE